MSTTITIVLWAVIVIHALGAMTTAATVGKPRDPLTGGVAAATVFTSFAFIMGAALALLGF